MNPSKITLGTIELPSYSATGWSFRDLVDWWGQTADKAEIVERPQGHGAFPARGSLRTSRAISFIANCINGSQAAVESGFDDLSSVGAEGPVLMTVETPAGASWRVVKVESVKPTHHRGGSRYGVLAVDLIAPDPRRYADGAWQQTGPAVQSGGLVWPAVWPLVWPVSGSSGRVTLQNPGRAPSPAVFRLLGPFDSALITCVESGARVGFNRPVPAGSVVEISGRHAVIDGQSDVSRWLQFREWTDVPGGESRTFQFDPVGGTAAFMQGKVDPAWW